MKCLNCKWVRIDEYGFKGRLGESLITCFLCNVIDGDMDNCIDYYEI
jgi:hypothetical protein